MRAGVYISEINLSGSVQAKVGVYAGIQIQAPKGDIDRLGLVGRDLKLLKDYTPDETIKIGYDNAFWDALAYLQFSNKLWVSRLVNNAGFASAVTQSLEYDDFTKNNITGNVLFDKVTGFFSIANSNLKSQLQSGTPIKFNTNTNLPTPVIAGTVYYVIKRGEATFELAIDQSNSLLPTPVAMSLTDKVTKQTVTFTASNPIITVTNSDLDVLLVDNVKAYFTSTSTLAAPLQVNIDYYVKRVTATTFKLATSLGNLTANIFIAPSTAGTGTHTLNIKADLVNHSITTPVANLVSLEGVVTFDDVADTVTISGVNLLNRLATSTAIRFKTDGNLPLPLNSTDYYYLIDLDENNYPNTDANFKLAISRDDSINNVPINIITAGTGVHKVVLKNIDPVSYPFKDKECLQFYNKDPGDWGNAIAVRLKDNRLKVPESFLVEVYKLPDLTTALETFVCSRRPDAKDGYNRSIYIENVLRSSNYIRCEDNPLVDPDTFPMFQSLPLRLQGGDKGDDVTIGKMVTDLSAKFKNTDRYPLTMLMDAGRAYTSNTAYAKAILSLAELRGDCIGVLSTPLESELDSNFLDSLVDYKRNTLNVSSSWGALYTPHVKIYDKYNDRSDLIVSPSGYVSGLISKTGTDQKIWVPAAGKRRGAFNTIDGLIRNFEPEELDYLSDNGLNCIRYIEGDGMYLWGDKSLLSIPSALDRIHVRLLLTYLEPMVRKTLDDYIFEANDDATRGDVTQKLKGLLTGIQSDRGVYSFVVMCNDVNNSLEDIDAYIMNVWVFIKPTKSVEYIPVKVIMTRTSLDFNLAAELIV